MIKVFYGDDRVRAKQEIKKLLGEKYEVIEGSELEPNDLPSIFMGASLFTAERKILIRDVADNRAVSEKIQDYVDTSHEVVIFEQKIAKNSNFYKSLVKKVEFREFRIPETSFYMTVSNIYNTAKKDGKKASEMLEEIKLNEDPIGFVGMMSALALKEYNKRQGRKEKRVLLELSKLDMKLKTTSLSPWLLIQSFLLQLSCW